MAKARINSLNNIIETRQPSSSTKLSMKRRIRKRFALKQKIEKEGLKPDIFEEKRNQKCLTFICDGEDQAKAQRYNEV
jgi:hypothetical protein